MCSQKYGDLYVISYLLPTMIFCMYMQLPSYKTLISTPFENNTSGKYITPHNFLYQTFLKTIKWRVGITFKQHLVIIECDHFYKIVLLNMEMVVWFILVVDLLVLNNVKNYFKKRLELIIKLFCEQKYFLKSWEKSLAGSWSCQWASISLFLIQNLEEPWPKQSYLMDLHKK